jgi:ATP-dependent RNA helicase RhlE
MGRKRLSPQMQQLNIPVQWRIITSSLADKGYWDHCQVPIGSSWRGSRVRQSVSGQITFARGNFPEKSYMQFSDLRLAEPILRALVAEGYSVPTPIQAQAIPHVLAGKDLLGVAQTGTGKTAAFALPIIHRLGENAGSLHQHQGRGRPIRCLVLSPTRELAVQIGESFAAYGKNTGLRQTVIFGGVGQGAQVQALRHGVDVLIATPGRLMDLMQQGYVDLRHVQVFVLDEADRMLDMGFIHDIRRIIPKLPAARQNLMFSATMPREISDLAHTILRNPVKVEVTPVASTVDKIEQSVYFVEKRNKPHLLAHFLDTNAVTRALVFTRTKHGADRVVRQLQKYGIKSEAIHGNKSQNARQRALGNFKSGKTMVLIASDIAARGIDIDEISHVVNYDLSNEPETYVHRIGRTARAGASGVAVSFCDSEERTYLRAIEKLIKRTIPVCKDHPQYPSSSSSTPIDTLVQGHSGRPPRERHHAPRSTHAQAPAKRPAYAASPASAPGAGAGVQRRLQQPNRRVASHPLAGRGKRFGYRGRGRA